MSQVTEKWNKSGIPEPDEIIERLYEIHNVDADNFYTAGKFDYSKICKNGMTHLLRSIVIDNSGNVINGKIYSVQIGYVYLILSDNGLTKIGKSENPEERFCSLQRSSPCQLKLYYTQFVKNCNKLEKFMHLKFKAKRVKGEWFNLSHDELEQAKRVLIDHQWITN